MSAIAERLERLSPGSTDVDCGAAWLVEAGQPADCLVGAATKAEAALIVVGSTRSRSSMFSGISADVSRRAPCPVVVVPPAAHACAGNGRREGRGRAGEDRDFAGGIARLGVGGGGTDFAGGIARLGLGRPARTSPGELPGSTSGLASRESDVEYDRRMRSELVRWESEGGAVPSDDDTSDTEATGDESTDEDLAAYAAEDRRPFVGFVQR